MFLLPLAILLSGTPHDGLAPLEPGLAQAGTRFDLVLRPESGGCRLLLCDAESDAPVPGAKLALQRFGKAGTKPSDDFAMPGQYEGHYLADCPAAGEALVVNASAAGGADLFTFTLPVPSKESSGGAGARPKAAAVPLALVVLALLLAVGLRRRHGQGAGVLLLALVLVTAGDAAAHGAGEAGLPIAPGSELGLGQEIQFALGLRTTRVTLASFQPPRDLSGAAPRTSPAVPRSAVVERDGKKLVFVRLAPERFVAREVTLGWSGPTQVAVEAGLQPGDLAVVAGGGFLRNGGAIGAATSTTSASTGAGATGVRK